MVGEKKQIQKLVRKGEPIGRLALKKRLINRDQLQEALDLHGDDENKKRLGEILRDKGWIDDEQLKNLLNIQKSTPDEALPEVTPSSKDLELEAGQDLADTEAIEIPAITLKKTETISPKPQPIAKTLLAAAKHHASDVHIHVGRPLMMRLHGHLVQAKMAPYDADSAEELLLEILTDEQKDSFLQKGDLEFAYAIAKTLRARVTYVRQHRGGIDATFRIFPMKIPTLSELNLPGSLAKFSTYHQGIVLFSGPTGCGTTTTMAALLDMINSDRSKHIITVEDPIEYLHKSKRCLVQQRQIIAHTDGFSRALKASLREDPDIIVVGELRDRETMSLAMTAAETGHLVYGTLHTTNAVNTINRIVDSFPPEQGPQIRTMLSESLRGVISQQLVQRLDKKGRIPIMEILTITPAIGNLIRDNKTFQIPGLMQVGKSHGMLLLDDSLEDLLSRGLIDTATAISLANNSERFSGKKEQ